VVSGNVSLYNETDGNAILREENMTPYEIMLSESQERMLMVIDPQKEEMAKAVFDKWGLDFAVIGAVTDSGNVVVKMNGKIYADIPSLPLSENAPEYDRNWE